MSGAREALFEEVKKKITIKMRYNGDMRWA
jgi:hypothetical protein